MYFPSRSPDHVRSAVDICDDSWHYLSAILEKDRVRLFVDGKNVADQAIKEQESKFPPTGFALGGLVEKGIGCDGLIDEVRLSTGVRDVSKLPSGRFPLDESVIALWRFDEITPDSTTKDDSPHHQTLKLRSAQEPPDTTEATPADPHFEKGSVGFQWKEEDSADERWNFSDVGPFLASVVPLPAEPPIPKGLSIRVGEKGEAAICYDTQKMQWRAGWTGGFLRFSSFRYGLISPPNAAGDFQIVTRMINSDTASKPRYIGLRQHGTRIVLSYDLGNTRIDEHPWFEVLGRGFLFTRSLEVAPSTSVVRLPIGTWKGPLLSTASDAGPWCEISSGSHLLAIAAVGASLRSEEHDENTTLYLESPPGDHPLGLKILLWKGDREDLPLFAAHLRDDSISELAQLKAARQSLMAGRGRHERFAWKK